MLSLFIFNGTWSVIEQPCTTMALGAFPIKCFVSTMILSMIPSIANLMVVYCGWVRVLLSLVHIHPSSLKKLSIHRHSWWWWNYLESARLNSIFGTSFLNMFNGFWMIWQPSWVEVKSITVSIGISGGTTSPNTRNLV